MEIKKLLDTITEHTFDIIFGILSGSGLAFLVGAMVTWIIIYIPNLQAYLTLMYVALYLFILISTSLSFTKGWFRVIYLISALILLFAYIYTKTFGGLS